VNEGCSAELGHGNDNDGGRFLTKFDTLGKIGGGDLENERGGVMLVEKEGVRTVELKNGRKAGDKLVDGGKVILIGSGSFVCTCTGVVSGKIRCVGVAGGVEGGEGDANVVLSRAGSSRGTGMVSGK
jgi:hypothetical protein